MKILYLTAFVPYPETRGGRLRVGNLIRVLGGDHDLHLLSLDSETHASHERPYPFEKYLSSFDATVHELKRKPAAFRALVTRQPYESCLARNAKMHEKVMTRLDKLQPDVVLVSRLSMLQYVPAEWLNRTVLDQHDLSRRLWRIMIRNEKSWLVKMWQKQNLSVVSRYEEKFYRRIAGFVSVSRDEKQETSGFCGDAISAIVVPNGVDTSRYLSDRSAEIDTASVVLVGAMDQRRNVDAARYLAKEIMPHVWRRCPDCAVWIVGRSPLPSVTSLGQIANVNVTGEVVDERPYIDKAGVAVAPFRMGSGVKHKVPIALSMGKALVATENAVHGVPVIDGEHCIVVDNPREFAAAIVKFIENRDYALEFGRAARQFAEDKLTWQACAAGLSPFLEKLLASKGTVDARSA